MKKLKAWYIDEGYSLARVSGPNRVTPDGIIQLDLCLLDEVGNRSDPCTSVAVIKDTTGPTINLDLLER